MPAESSDVVVGRAKVVARPAPVAPGWVLVGVLLGFAAFNILLFRLFGVQSEPPEWLRALGIGAWVFQPMLFAIWTALGPGWLVIRLPLVVPCLMLVIAAPGVREEGFQDLERYEFVVMAIAGMVIFAATTTLLLVLRFVGWRVGQQHALATCGARRLQFDIKYLIILITLFAIVLGMMSNLVFSPPEPSPFFGPGFFVRIVVIGGATTSGLLLPLMAVPLMVLSSNFSKRATCCACAFWVLMTSAIVVIWIAIHEENLLGLALVLQLGAAIAGTLAALALRLVGYRLSRPSQQNQMRPTLAQS